MKIAINRNVINKATEKQQFAQLTHTFENMDVTQQEFAELINQGFAFCAQHKNKHRKSTNFTSSGIIAVDIDHGPKAHKFDVVLIDEVEQVIAHLTGDTVQEGVVSILVTLPHGQPCEVVVG
jgi:hypothetical protein